MRTRARVSGGRAFAASLRRHVQELEKDVQAVLRQEARALAISYGLATVPFGQSTGPKYRKKIEADVGKVFATRDDAPGVYRMLKRHAPQLASAYWAAHKSGKKSRADAIVRKAGLPQGGASRGGMKQYRTRADGAVGRINEPTSLVRSNERNKVIRESQATVGTAKAGWHQAGKALGARTRRNLVSATGKRTTVEAFPAYVRKVSRKFSGLGGAFVGRNRVRIWTNVRHARKAMRPRLQKAAEHFARDNVSKAMEYAAAARNERWNRSA
jgi:hypothetical protein